MTAFEVVCDFSSRLTAAGIAHVIGGSVASSVWGEPRQTNDADFEIWLDESNVESFLGACSEPYHVSEAEVTAELASHEVHRVVQVMHAEEAFKIDCFIVSDAFSQSGLERVRRVDLGDCKLPVAAAEYILLRKLAWFELGRRVSDRQWNDIRGLVQVQRDELDVEWLRRWAGVLGVEELLESALSE